MKISIWQQWSSNHSASFLLVGLFPDPQSARSAADQIQQILVEIDAWQNDEKNADENLRIWKEIGEQGWDRGLSLRPPEKHFAGRYGIDWKHPIDWRLPEPPTCKAVFHVDTLVFVGNCGQTYLGSHPFDLLLPVMGASQIVGEYESKPGAITVDIACRAPDTDKATTISDDFEYHMIDPTQYVPWEKQGRKYTENRHDWWKNDLVINGEVRVKGRQLTFSKLQFYLIEAGFPGLIDYLRDQGCENLHYTLSVQESRDADFWM